MAKHLIRTYPIKSLTIFLAVAFVLSTGMIVLFALLTWESMLIRVLVFIFCGLFTFASGFMLINQTMFYVAVDDNYFIKYAFFSQFKAAFNKIEKITNKDGFYTVYAKGKKFANFTTNTKEGQEMIVFLEKKGVKIEW